MSATRSHTEQRDAAAVLAPVAARLTRTVPGGWPVRVRLWDGSELQVDEPVPEATLVIRSRHALTRILRRPDELALARAWVAGELDIEGDLESGLMAGERLIELRPRLADRIAILRAAVRLGALRLKTPPPPATEARLSGRAHTARRDRAAMSHHYDVSNAFYRLVLGPTMVYTAACFADEDDSLEAAQTRKLDLVCRKLELAEGERLLDVGCGWGSLALHAARHYGARVVAITISKEQAEFARERVREAGVADQCEIRHGDFRELDDGPYDKVASIGFMEHIGARNFRPYLALVRRLIAPGGLFLNQSIVRGAPSELAKQRFITRYVFPDAEATTLGTMLEAMSAEHFDIRDVESLREHYSATLRAWLRNLAAARDDAIAEVGVERERIWRLYMAASVLAFDRGALSVHQTLLAAPPARSPALLRPRPRAVRQGWEKVRDDLPAASV